MRCTEHAELAVQESSDRPGHPQQSGVEVVWHGEHAGRVVVLGDDEGHSQHVWIDVKKCQEAFVFPDAGAAHFAPNDAAEHAVGHPDTP